MSPPLAARVPSKTVTVIVASVALLALVFEGNGWSQTQSITPKPDPAGAVQTPATTPSPTPSLAPTQPGLSAQATVQPAASTPSTPSIDQRIFNEAFKILFVAFVIALLLESGLAVIFNWRPFLVLFDGRGVKTIVSVLFAWIMVSQFDLDLVTRLVNIYSGRTPPYDNGFLGSFVTALVIAGGTAVVNKIMVSLGFRSLLTATVVAPQPPRTEGWVSVTVVRKAATKPVTVLIGDPATGPPAANTVDGGTALSAFLRLFLRDPNRFPRSGGFPVPAGSTCVIELRGLDSHGNPVPATSASKWGPEAIAPGAIIDLTLTL